MNSVVKALWEIEAISVNTKEQFTLVSGKKSPIYIDCRKLISYPQYMDLFAEVAKEKIEKEIGSENIEVLAGGATAGIPYAAWLSSKTGLSMIYVRTEPKGHGKGKQIEGSLDEGKKVLLVEDLITDGKSKLSFIKGIRDADGIIENCIVLFDREQGGTELLSKEGVKLHGLVSLSEALEFGLENNFISKGEFETVQKYLEES